MLPYSEFGNVFVNSFAFFRHTKVSTLKLSIIKDIDISNRPIILLVIKIFI